MKAAVLFLVAVLFAVTASFGQTQPSQSFTQDFYNATGALYSQDKAGERNFRCTATVIEKTTIGYHMLTAKHCLEDAPSTYAVLFDEYSHSAYQPAVVLFADIDSDLAVFDVVTDLIVPVIPLGDETLEPVGAPVINMAVPLNLGKLLFHGFIATKRLAEADGDKDGLGIQLPAAGGSSGSAVVSETQHAIIGVVISIAVPPNGGELFVVAVPVSQVKAALQDYKAGKLPYIQKEPAKVSGGKKEPVTTGLFDSLGK